MPALRNTIENLKIAVTVAGGTLADIVKTTVYLGDVRLALGPSASKQVRFR